MGLVIGIATYKTYRLCAYFVGVYGYYSLFFTFIDGSNFAFVADLFDEVFLVFIFFGLLLPILLANKNNYTKIYIFFVGGIRGYPISTMINNFIISFINITYKRLILIICIIIGIILANYYPKQTCFIGSSLISSYLIMRGISFFLQDIVPFIDDKKICDLDSSENYEKKFKMLKGLSLIYPPLFIIFIIIVIIAKFKLYPNWKVDSNYLYLNMFL